MVAALLLLGACGGDDEEATPTPKASATGTASPATSTATPSVTGTATPPAGPTTEAQGAFPELPLDQITDLQISEDQRQLTVVSTLGPTDFERAGQLCVLLRNYSRFSIEPQVRILASDGTTEITYCG